MKINQIRNKKSLNNNQILNQGKLQSLIKVLVIQMYRKITSNNNYNKYKFNNKKEFFLQSKVLPNPNKIVKSKQINYNNNYNSNLIRSLKIYQKKNKSMKKKRKKHKILNQEKPQLIIKALVLHNK
jgi:hypothetical protein